MGHATEAPSAPTITRPARVAEPRITVQWLPPYRVVVHNNDYNTFDQVISILMKAVSGMSQEEAVGHAYEIHLTGSTVPFRGRLDEAETVAKTIRTIGIKVTLEPDS